MSCDPSPAGPCLCGCDCVLRSCVGRSDRSNDWLFELPNKNQDWTAKAMVSGFLVDCQQDCPVRGGLVGQCSWLANSNATLHGTTVMLVRELLLSKHVERKDK